MDGNAVIAAISTPLGVGGIGVVRISGDGAFAVADRMVRTAKKIPVSQMPGYTCAYGRACDRLGEIDEVIVTVFHAPHSFTGEDVVEIASHGGVYLVNRILRAAYECGARPAEAGEFTRRAFLNGKLDLTRAEAVGDLIAAQGRQAARAALTARDGALYQRIEKITGKLVAQAGHLAAWIDYPEEEIVEVDAADLAETLRECERDLRKLLATYDAGKVIREGIEVAIVGRPNVGKSTLMNLLAGYQRSIVSEQAGTTRDVVSDSVRLGEIVLHLSDTAGIRASDDPIEQAGVELAVDRLQRAQLVLAVFDGSEALSDDDRRVIAACKGIPAIALVNKNDLEQRLDLGVIQDGFAHVLQISAKQADGAQQLEERITELFALGKFDPSAAILANERQRAGALAAVEELAEAICALESGVSYDAVCVCIENSIDALLTLTGKRASQEVVDQVFSKFCVGK
ncbi:tRNA uridine-5-carboxymethylaminomethyl(34) synthesis GTPase MnmE [Anaerotruncus rubiinfantis]|jgi:tRNA modification GTPase|uniref:tRNA uridine-5-carboxymethylaminomethyl(34) synthesis GTPase MnmE n=1 Tax=Anaerotruncus rubiinfantis TaxID=1720200 RepID=UPI0018987EEF|nr:tRNA uridine-5-carboxymethylaminomethyl(34) synthesis GTPase MnmE [Anaerotruncus rubiinfantis]